VSSKRDFFEKPQPAAVLKHGILKRYVPVFASKTGSQSEGGRVVYIDGYAGEGLYKDGSPGSPALAVDVARQIAQTRELRCFFIEKKRKVFDVLKAYLDEKATDLDCVPLRGGVEDHLDELLAMHPNEPMFVFLDPFGVGIDFGQATRLLARGRGGYPKTEVLMNFSVQGIDRIGGMIASSAKNRDATLRTLNDSMGGNWWQKVYETTRGGDRLSLIATEYRHRLEAATGGKWSGWTVPVADKIGARPEYLLLHFTQHPDGHWEFHQSLSLATREWREAAHAAHPDERRQLEELGQFAFEDFDQPEFEEDEAAWVEELAKNVAVILASGRPQVVQSDMKALFGKTMGLAREHHLRKALKPMYKAGQLANEPKGDLQRYVIARATTPPRAP
jgi:three-Cys-motif partner protein